MSTIKVACDAYGTCIHDTERDDLDWPVLATFGWTQEQADKAEALAARVRERLPEYEAAIEADGHFGACEFVAECGRP